MLRIKNSKKFFRKKRTIAISLVVATFLFISAKKIFEYAAPQIHPKDCDFIFPNTIDQTKPISVVSKTPEHLITLAQTGGFINDASCLNKTAVYGVVTISTVDDVRNALLFARENNLKVTSAGQHHSMGGQSFVRNGLVLDMRNFNKITVDTENKILHTQTGAKWQQIQDMLDTKGLAVKAMQSINIFTVGGTLSVNAHGIAQNPGPVASTVKSFRIMLSDGEIQTASPIENPELYASALGGYGLFGVILDADIEVVDNEVYDWHTSYIDYKNFPEYYAKNIAGNDQIGLTYSRISISPTSYLTQTAVHTFVKTAFDEDIPSVKADEHNWMNRLVINFSKTGALGRWTRWTLEKLAVPRLYSCMTRNQAMSQKEVCLVSRNKKMYDPMEYLKNRLQDTDILQEYFIPRNKMPEFVDGLRDIVKDDGANLLNVTIRTVDKDTVTALPYAKEDMFAFVLYFNQKFNTRESEILQKTTTDLIDLSNGLSGTYYLPYQLLYSPEQLRGAYPEIDTFFATKKKYDPISLFENTFYQKYGKTDTNS